MKELIVPATMDELMHVQEFITEELRDFLVGTYVAKKLKHSCESGELTPKAMKLGDVTTRTTDTGGIEVIYGDEALYQEMMHSKSYAQIFQK